MVDPIDLMCETPSNLQVFLGNIDAYGKQRMKKKDQNLFNEDVVHLDQDDARPESSDKYMRRPPRNNNFVDRPNTTKD